MGSRKRRHRFMLHRLPLKSAPAECAEDPGRDQHRPKVFGSGVRRVEGGLVLVHEAATKFALIMRHPAACENEYPHLPH